MPLRVQKTGNALKELADVLPQRFAAAAEHIGRTLAEQTRQLVADGLPATGGWYAIYRAAIRAFEDDGVSWLIAGSGPVPDAAVPANSTLLTFSGGDPIADVLVPYNPWTADALPPIAGGYSTTITASAASPDAVSQERRRLVTLLPVVLQALTAAGARVLPDGSSVIINGDLYTDVVYLATRLETGADGFPKIPVWERAAKALPRKAPAWVRGQMTAVASVLKGTPGASELPPVPSAVRQTLAP